MKLHTLQPNPGSKKKNKRLGRGPGSGLGKTAGKGHKGLLARSGRANVVGFEGGQMPLARRLPKRGFHNPFRKVYAIVNIGVLNGLSGIPVITPLVLIEKGIVKRKNMPVKVLGHGQAERPINVEAHSFSKSALEKIQQSGGQAKVISRA